MNDRKESVLGWSLLVARLLLVGIFGMAAIAKLSQENGPALFAVSIDAFEILPEHLVILATFVFPWMEAFAALALLLGLWTRAGAALATLLMLAFTGAVYSAIYRDMQIDCGCFGGYLPDFLKKVLGTDISTRTLIRNGIIIALCLFVVVGGPGKLGLDNLLTKKPANDPEAEDDPDSEDET